jgi:antitoxin component of MazEF toxin-antitoxin module
MKIPNKGYKRIHSAARKAEANRKMGEKSGAKEYSKSRIRPIGNSQGVILSNQLMEAAGFNSEDDIVIEAGDGLIYITQVKQPGINTDLSTWDRQVKTAIKKGNKPESIVFKGPNDFDLTEW